MAVLALRQADTPQSAGSPELKCADGRAGRLHSRSVQLIVVSNRRLIGPCLALRSSQAMTGTARVCTEMGHLRTTIATGQRSSARGPHEDPDDCRHKSLELRSEIRRILGPHLDDTRAPPQGRTTSPSDLAPRPRLAPEPSAVASVVERQQGADEGKNGPRRCPRSLRVQRLFRPTREIKEVIARLVEGRSDELEMPGALVSFPPPSKGGRETVEPSLLRGDEVGYQAFVAVRQTSEGLA